jgi:hypothetical protein
MSNLLPEEKPAEESIQLHLRNLIAVDFAKALDEAAQQATYDWADDTGTVANAFMEDHIREMLLSRFIGYFFKTQPRSNQISGAHVDAFHQLSDEPTPPAKDPEPLEG